MSFNLEISAGHVSGGWCNMRLTGVSRGITHSASVSVGETIIFPGGVEIKVKQINHLWEPPGSAVAPVSVAYGQPINEDNLPKLLDDDDFQRLQSLGFVYMDK